MVTGPSEMNPVRPRVLYILGAGHCGSTLLSLLLNGHPACLAVSELAKLAESIRDRDPVLERPEWLAARRCYESRANEPFDALELGHPSWKRCLAADRAAATAWCAPRVQLMSCLVEAAQRPWIVDASKSWQSLYMMQRSRELDIRVVHLVRDGRGIVHSYATKYGDLGHGLSKWLKPSVAAIALERQFRGRWLRVRYEDLATETENTLRRICALLELEYTAEMLRFRSHPWLGIGGNRMSKRTDEKIRFDERWRREMSWRQQLVVNAVGGAVNRYYGY